MQRRKETLSNGGYSGNWDSVFPALDIHKPVELEGFFSICPRLLQANLRMGSSVLRTAGMGCESCNSTMTSEEEVWVMVLRICLIDFFYFYLIGGPKLKTIEMKQGEYVSFFSFMYSKKSFLAWLVSASTISSLHHVDEACKKIKYSSSAVCVYNCHILSFISAYHLKGKEINCNASSWN